ncbi:hypothetical protein FA13DRAFT_1791338 [Coprinellus micaceus]|uniref:Uncharacterized protein n=1 Tax=Coprinellus micaceus TaxID=71717 RepID=A0A4Y7TBM9_COPMI|nr:hypothetical protein FA13DRAFT_1791338 [Coprinellus micaceus]
MPSHSLVISHTQTQAMQHFFALRGSYRTNEPEEQAIEAEARAELSALLRVYWSGCRARSYSKRRRDGCAALKESDPRAQDSQRGEEMGREDMESQLVKEGIRALQRKVMKLKEERVPYEDVLRPLSPTHNRSYVFRDGRFSTLPSSAMSPTHLTSVLSDPAIASCIEELDVSLRLWAGWEWDVDEEWAMELKIQGGGKGERDANNPGDGDLIPASKQVDLPKLKKLAISTGNVPIGALLEMMTPPLGSIEVTRIRIEDDCAAQHKAASTRPSMGSTKRRRESLRERRIRVASRRVSRCLDGLDLILQHAAGDIEVCLPVGVQSPASVQGLALETVHRPER